MSTHPHSAGGSNMASRGRENLARLVLSFMRSSGERDRAKRIAASGIQASADEYVFREHVRFVAWLERTSLDEEAALDQGLRNKAISAWLLNLPNYLAARELAASLLLDELVGTVQTEVDA